MRLSLDRIARAAREIDPVFRDTPQFESDALGARLGVPLVVKVESVNPIRSFKGRGTDFLFRTLVPCPGHVVCASAGNFGQGVAWAARRRGAACDVFAATNANPLKLQRMRDLGATVHAGGSDFDEAKAIGREFARHAALPFIEDGREAAIAEGAATIAVELFAGVPAPDTLLVPLGNGALLGGIATWTRHVAPRTRVLGVCARGAPAMERSWRAGHPVETDRVETIADGIAVRVPVPEALDDLAGLVDDILLVGEDALRKAMRLVLDSLGLLVEPAGVAGIAALIEHGADIAAGRVATPLCGGNVTAQQRVDWALG